MEKNKNVDKPNMHIEDAPSETTIVDQPDKDIKSLIEENGKLKQEVRESNNEKEIAESKLATALSQYIRLQADFDNFRRRTRENEVKMEDAVKAKVLKSFLPVLDNFEMAVAQIKKTDTAGDAFVKGLELLLKQFISFLKDSNVTEIEAEGKPFDPYFHEAIMQITSDQWDDDTVSMVMKKGYKYKDQVLRPASVQVSHKP